MFKLEIETQNAAFGETDCETFQEIGWILRRLRARMTKEAADDVGDNRTKRWEEPLRDTNGNKIGSFIYEGSAQ
tara:strand:+ start:154 stop:375 length:222 start_codon:yes stop_codon:yes gene_type:complete